MASNFNFGSTFGAQPAQQQQQQQQQGTSTLPSFSFSGPAASTSSPAPFSFNNPSASTASNPTATGGGLFGGGGQTQQQQGQQQPASGGFSFAKPAQAPTPQPFQSQTSTGLFGQPQQAQAGGSSLFGNTSTQGNQQSGGLFGSTTQQQPQGGGNMFGLNQNQNQQQQQQQQQGLQNSTLGASQNGGQGGITKTTKFSELPVDMQKHVEGLDSWIKERKAASSGINTDEVGKAIWRTTTEIKSCTEESSALTQSLQNTKQALISLQSRFVIEEEDLRRLVEIWETHKAANGRPGISRVAGHKEWPGEFFGRIARGLEERAARYKVTIAQLNRVVAGLMNESETPSPHAIAQTIHNHQTALMTLAAQLESLQNRMNGLKGAYAAEYRDRTGSMRDPFEVAREEKGLPPVRA